MKILTAPAYIFARKYTLLVTYTQQRTFIHTKYINSSETTQTTTFIV